MTNAADASETPKRHRVFLVEAHEVVRQGLTRLINQEPDLIVCGEGDGSMSVLAALAHLQPDILVLDISLNGPDGIDVLKTVRSADERLRILVLSTHDESTHAERAIRAGANGYVMKQEAMETVLPAIRRLLRHEVYVSDRIASRMLRQFASGSSKAKSNAIAGAKERRLDERVN